MITTELTRSLNSRSDRPLSGPVAPAAADERCPQGELSRGLLRHAASMDKRAALHGDAAAALALIKQIRANDADMGSLPDQKVADLLRALSAAGAEAQVSSLAARAATDTVFWTLWTSGGLPKAMRETGAGAQANLFEKRILEEGELQDYFNRDGMTRYRFGREPYGTPAEPWGWYDLL